MEFNKLAGGEAGQQFQRAFEEILANIADANTDAKKKRALVIEMTFEPDENRDLANVTIQAKTKLAPAVHSLTRIVIGKDKKTGRYIADEFGSKVKDREVITIREEDSFTQDIFK